MREFDANELIGTEDLGQGELHISPKGYIVADFFVSGHITTKTFRQDGKIYYCGWSSYPEEIVSEVLINV